VEPAAVVDALDEGADRVAGLAQIAIVSAVDLLLLECLHEALRLGVVVGIADAAHARLDAMRFQYARVLAASVLHAPIGMMDQAVGRRLTRRNRHLQSRRGKARAQMRVQGPTDHSPAEGIKHHRQKGKLLQHPNIGDVRDPQLIQASEHQAARQVRHYAPLVTRISRHRHEGALAQT
jgi:hypothetical protein